jgi:hypothetical protein
VNQLLAVGKSRRIGCSVGDDAPVPTPPAPLTGRLPEWTFCDSCRTRRWRLRLSAVRWSESIRPIPPPPLLAASADCISDASSGTASRDVVASQSSGEGIKGASKARREGSMRIGWPVWHC